MPASLKVLMASIKIKSCEDGTFTLYRDGNAVSTGLTRDQAHQLATVLRSIESKI